MSELKFHHVASVSQVAEGKMIDQLLGLEKQEEHRDIINFRRNLVNCFIRQRLVFS